MTLQPSLIIWTVVCFCLLMLVLHKLLFKPMLTFMDARSEKIASARLRAEKAAEEREEALSRLENERTLALRSAQESARARAEAFTREAEAELDSIAKANERELETLSASGDDEMCALVSELDRRMDEFETAYIEKLGSYITQR